MGDAGALADANAGGGACFETDPVVGRGAGAAGEAASRELYGAGPGADSPEGGGGGAFDEEALRAAFCWALTCRKSRVGSRTAGLVGGGSESSRVMHSWSAWAGPDTAMTPPCQPLPALTSSGLDPSGLSSAWTRVRTRRGRVSAEATEAGEEGGGGGGERTSERAAVDAADDSLLCGADDWVSPVPARHVPALLCHPRRVPGASEWCAIEKTVPSGARFHLDGREKREGDTQATAFTAKAAKASQSRKQQDRRACRGVCRRAR